MVIRDSLSALVSAFSEPSPKGGQRELRLVASAIMYFAGGLVMSCARILDIAAPFGIAAVAAAGTGINGVCCLIGAAIGYVAGGGISWGIRYLAAVFLVFTLGFSFRETRVYGSMFFSPTAAALVALTTGVLSGYSLVMTELNGISTLVLETVLSFGGCCFFSEALRNDKGTTELSELRYVVSVMITVSIALTAVSRLVVFDLVSVGRVLSLIVLMLYSMQGGLLVGCATGTVFGIAMDIASSGMPFYSMAYAFSGLMSGLLNKHGRVLFLFAFILANAASAAFVWHLEPQLSGILELMCAALIFAVLPAELINRAGAYIRPAVTGGGESGLRRYISRRVSGLSLAYSGLYEIVRRNVEDSFNDTDPAKVFDRAADSVCARCREKNRCWNTDYMDTLSALNDASNSMQKRGTLKFEDIPSRFSDKCTMPEAFVTAVNGELRAQAYRRHFAAELRESRDTAWGLYSDIAEILSGVSAELSSVNGADRLAERRLIRFLRGLDIEADASVFRDSRGRLRAVLESGSLARLYSEEDYLEKLSAVVGTRLCKPKVSKESMGKLVLIEAEPLSVNVGIAAMKKKGEKVSGDKGTYFKTDEGVLCVILSDGMGCGADAAQGSREVIEILERFLQSGLDPCAAMKTLNSVMLLKSGDNWGFATVDLMCVDLFTGETCFYKYGAAPSYVYSGKSIKRIDCVSFAPGLNSDKGGAPDTVRMRLKPGSTAIIASDGVIGDSNDKWLRDILCSAGDDMKILARDTLREAEKNYGDCDDMTVLAVRVQERA